MRKVGLLLEFLLVSADDDGGSNIGVDSRADVGAGGRLYLDVDVVGPRAAIRWSPFVTFGGFPSIYR